MLKICANCNIEFDAKQSIVKHCSRACGFEARTKRRIAKCTKACQQCGKTFVAEIKPDRESKFCSRKCFSSSQSVEKVARNCEYCGKECLMFPSRLKEFRFCSHACCARATCVGKWIGVKVVKRISIELPYERPYYKRQSSRARKRDGYQCQHCGKLFEKGTCMLDTHHIVPLRSGGSDHLDNLISLCRSCHSKADYQLRLKGDTCVLCDTPIPTTNTTGYCPEHYKQSPQYKATREKINKRLRRPRVIYGKTAYACHYCKKEFYRQRCNVKVAQPYCSKPCYFADRFGRPITT